MKYEDIERIEAQLPPFTPIVSIEAPRGLTQAQFEAWCADLLASIPPRPDRVSV